MKLNLHIDKKRGFTLIEVSVSLLLVSTIVLALMSVRYYAHSHAVRADVYTRASRLALLLIESWRSATAVADFDPENDFDTTGETVITPSETGPPVPDGFTELGSYLIILETETGHNWHFYATLAYIDETLFDPAILHVCIGWAETYSEGDVATHGRYYNLTTYE